MKNRKERAFRFIDDHREEMLSLWREIVGIESGSSCKAGVDAVAVRLKKELDNAGGRTRVIQFEKAGSMLISDFGESRPQAGIIFMGHMDTVFEPGTTAKRPFTIKDGKVLGPGVLDMKGGIVAFVYALKALKHVGYNGCMKVILAGDEEVAHADSNAADKFIEESRGYAAAFNCESGFVDNGIVVGRKGVAQFVMEAKGTAAHVGNDPENGRSAILEIAHKVIAIQNLTDWEKGITFNVGVIQGGRVPNAVPDYAMITVDVRYMDPDDLPVITGLIEGVAARIHVEGTMTTVRYTSGIKPMKTTDGVKQLFALVKKTSEENGFDVPYAKHSGGGSDSAYTVLAGVPTVCAMGVKGGRNHSPDEYAVVESLFERAKLLAACVLNLGDADGH